MKLADRTRWHQASKLNTDTVSLSCLNHSFEQVFVVVRPVTLHHSEQVVEVIAVEDDEEELGVVTSIDSIGLGCDLDDADCEIGPGCSLDEDDCQMGPGCNLDEGDCDMAQRMSEIEEDDSRKSNAIQEDPIGATGE